MNITTVEITVEITTVEITGESTHTEMLRWELQQNWQRNVDDFMSSARSIISDLERSMERAEEAGVTMNELGVLQGRGPALDRLCGLLKQQADMDSRLRRLSEGLEEQS